MRTFEEIDADINEALRVNNANALQVLAEEMQALGTPTAEARALNVVGSVKWINCDYPSALEHYRRALAMHEELGDRAAVANVNGNIGVVLERTGSYPSALEHFRQALDMYEELGDRAGVASATGNIGIVHMRTGQYPLALEHYQRALAVHEELGDRYGMVRIIGNMGTVFGSTGNYSSALEHFRRALTLNEELGDRSGVAFVTVNIGNVYLSTGDAPSALEHYSRALTIHEELGDRSSMTRVTANIGMVYRTTGDYPSALEYLRRALAMDEELGDRAGAARVTGAIGGVYWSTDDYPSAFDYYRRALTQYEELGNRDGMAHVTGFLGNLSYSTGDYSSALEYHRRALAMNEEVGNRAGVVLGTGNVISALMKLDRYDEAAVLLEHQSAMQMERHGVRAQYEANNASLAEHRGDLDAAHQHLVEALSITTEAGLRAESADYHEKLRNLAQKRNDFAGYIEHNNEYQRITEEVRGKEATQRMAMMEAERRMEGERREREKERALLYGALPKSVADRMVRGEDVSGDHFDHAAVMFLDIVGFTTNTSAMPPSDVVKMLEKIFRAFDAICETHDVVKVKTIGDSYMCFRGDADAATNAHSVASVALDMMNHTFTWHDGTLVQFRIGMHIGPATAGVIGTQRLQYDVWGDTVNVASRMESSGQAGRGHISAAFAAEIESTIKNQETDHESGIKNAIENREYRMEERGMVDVKGKGMMQTYWLERAS